MVRVEGAQVHAASTPAPGPAPDKPRRNTPPRPSPPAAKKAGQSSQQDKPDQAQPREDAAQKPPAPAPDHVVDASAMVEEGGGVLPPPPPPPLTLPPLVKDTAPPGAPPTSPQRRPAEGAPASPATVLALPEGAVDGGLPVPLSTGVVRRKRRSASASHTAGPMQQLAQVPADTATPSQALPSDQHLVLSLADERAVDTAAGGKLVVRSRAGHIPKRRARRSGPQGWGVGALQATGHPEGRPGTVRGEDSGAATGPVPAQALLVPVLHRDVRPRRKAKAQEEAAAEPRQSLATTMAVLAAAKKFGADPMAPPPAPEPVTSHPVPARRAKRRSAATPATASLAHASEADGGQGVRHMGWRIPMAEWAAVDRGSMQRSEAVYTADAVHRGARQRGFEPPPAPYTSSAGGSSGTQLVHRDDLSDPNTGVHMPPVDSVLPKPPPEQEQEQEQEQDAQQPPQYALKTGWEPLAQGEQGAGTQPEVPVDMFQPHDAGRPSFKPREVRRAMDAPSSTGPPPLHTHQVLFVPPASLTPYRAVTHVEPDSEDEAGATEQATSPPSAARRLPFTASGADPAQTGDLPMSTMTTRDILGNITGAPRTRAGSPPLPTRGYTSAVLAEASRAASPPGRGQQPLQEAKPGSAKPGATVSSGRHRFTAPAQVRSGAPKPSKAPGKKPPAPNHHGVDMGPILLQLDVAHQAKLAAAKAAKL
ncbi:unnamed protein product, partial [Symbiodinium sp. KB8]